MSETQQPIRIEDRDHLQDLDRRYGLPTGYSTDDDDVVDFWIGRRIYRTGRGFDSRPRHECPHCSSYHYVLWWEAHREDRNEAWWECDRCQLIRPFNPDDPEDMGGL